ncbi:hypothetical protein TSUD_149100 [Trifolium subterraneum]|uniref:Reverse transcriptase domain-containing protein n=1 Tax=Trifolium subterraneum TaxID=3900 RepID=A0A2Z6MZI4_TRISU|nr:hypothetical protein TSUD_149100 [Trifolium subterraneum]
MADDQEWKTVNRRRRQTKHLIPDIATIRRKYNMEQQTTYFFTDIPDSFGAKAMHFGFARFENVTDTRRFGLYLDTIIIGRDKISVNLSRFQRDRAGQCNNQYDEGNVHNKQSDVNMNISFERQKHNHVSAGDESYGHALRFGKIGGKKECNNQTTLSFVSEKEDLERLKKAFVGVVRQPGLSYNIQNEFHIQGYFGVKVTPLGANLTLLEGQDEGEVEALMEEARDWMEQWFKEVRPWTEKDVDLERLVWLRVYGIPAHAWNESFFTMISKSWGSFINADDVTTKKLSLDVARILIRTSGQRVVDEFIDVKVNNQFFHIRVIEDSYGPMRIMIPQAHRQEGRDEDSEEEEEAIFQKVEVEEEEERENAVVILWEMTWRWIKHWLWRMPNSLLVMERGGTREMKCSVYQDGPKVALLRLKNGPSPSLSMCPNENFFVSTAKRKTVVPRKTPTSPNLPSRSLRNQYQLAQSLEGRNQSKDSSSRSNSSCSVNESTQNKVELETCSRNPMGKHKKLKNSSSSISSAGSVLCCSSLKSVEIKNCNKNFWDKHEKEVASKVWKGVTELGVEGEKDDELYVEKLLVEDMMANCTGESNVPQTKELVKKIWEQLHHKESLLKQNSRLKWIQEGDSNTRFFHASIKGRRRRNQLSILKKGETWIQGADNIKKEAKDHFSLIFSEEWNNRPFLQGIDFNMLSAEDNAFLLEPFAEEEVKEIVWSCDGNKSPGPDGFNLNFLKHCWNTVKKDVMAFLVEFHGWMKWMRACIFEISMSILVNGSPTEDFKVQKGLRQGDPLSPFLFLIVTEGLTGMVRKAVDIGKFKGYKVNDSLDFQLLQFADDTILMGEGSWDNLWTFKTVLRGFELVSGLKINFMKSKLYGLNVEDEFLAAGSTFLSCRSDAIPFKFLGIPVGANPRRRETWRPVVEAMSKD